MNNGTLQIIVPLEQKEVGRRLAVARRRRHWTQLDFALRIGVSPASVSRWERGKLPPVKELMRVADALEIDPAELVEEREERAHLAEEIVALRKEIRELRAESKTRARGARRKKV